MDLKVIVAGLTAERKKLDKAISALTNINGNHHRVKRYLSKDARKRIGEAQRKRWARVKRIKNAA